MVNDIKYTRVLILFLASALSFNVSAQSLKDEITDIGWIYLDKIEKSRILVNLPRGSGTNYDGLDKIRSGQGETITIYGEQSDITFLRHVDYLAPPIVYKINNPIIDQLKVLLPDVEIRPYPGDEDISIPYFVLRICFSPSQGDDLIFNHQTEQSLLSFQLNIKVDLREYREGFDEPKSRFNYLRLGLPKKESLGFTNPVSGAYQGTASTLLKRELETFDKRMARITGNFYKKFSIKLSKYK